jgi:hypothetical protein
VFTAGVKQILARNEGGEETKKKGNKLLNDWSYSALSSHYSCGIETVITLMDIRGSKVG